MASVFWTGMVMAISLAHREFTFSITESTPSRASLRPRSSSASASPRKKLMSLPSSSFFASIALRPM
eukprot:11166633-Lingulodinium_polyedra.AAC.1